MTLSKEFWAGLIYIALASTGLLINSKHPLGSLANMGPGFFPMLILIILLIIGISLTVTAIMRTGDRPKGFAWRPILFVGGAFILFSVSIKPVGFIITIFTTVVLACLAEPSFRLTQILATATVITAIAYGIFIVILGLHIPILP